LERGIEHQLPNLTKQEIRVIKLVASGFDNDTITKTLHVTRNTVKTHMRNIFSKLGVSDRTQAAIWAIRSGLADEKVHD
jgi:DNA-binding NarL/FixJ family response regulator